MHLNNGRFARGIAMRINISVIIPVYNEEKNIPILYNKLIGVLNRLNKAYEIIFVDDGSTDKSCETICSLCKKDSRVKVVQLRKNFGQTAALDAGIKNSAGDYIITMDADLQNDPEDIAPLLEKLKEGYDVVSGWRYERKDPILKRLFSFFANFLRRHLLNDKIHDSGCTLKVYKRECLMDLDMYGEMHRYITGVLSISGYKIGELKVKHHPRKFGKTKYGYKRILKGFLDLFFIAFLTRYFSRPLHLFGGIGIFILVPGLVIGCYLALMKFIYNISLSNRPLLILSVLMVILGTQFMIFGILAEILVRVYYKTHNIKPYTRKKCSL